MGVRGLTTYIEKTPHYYYNKFYLQNTKLVIDGWNLSFQIYRNFSQCNCSFGGDYHQYAKSVESFFEELKKCNVIPIVILDGGWEDKKKKTIYLRAIEKLGHASNWKPKSQYNDKYLPAQWCYVFRNVMKKMNIKFFMCPFEADDIIVALARVYECPVLSYDSDFYISKAMYIPFNTLEAMSKNEYGYMKKCQIYKVETLLKQFEGLDVSLLPLASVLIGNDYVEANTFDNLVNKIQQFKKPQPKIALILNWLKNYSLHTAVGIIINSIPKKQQDKMINLIENIINSSNSSLPKYMLGQLGLTRRDILVSQANQLNVFKFDKNKFFLDTNPNTRLQCDEINDQNDYYFSKDGSNDNDKPETSLDLIPEEFVESMPRWFMYEYFTGNFPSSFINMITHQTYMEQTQIENFSSPSSGEISIPIVKAIFSLLIPKNKSESTLELMIRKKCDILPRLINVKRSTIAFEELREVDISKRKEFIDKILGINKIDKLDEMPKAWQLYIAAILFWMRQQVVPTRTTKQLTCLILSMLIGIIDQHMEPRKSELRLEKISSEIEKIITLTTTQKTNTNLDSKYMTVSEALELVTQHDCIVASQYFMDNFKMDDKLILNQRKFDIEVVHAFAQFQSCLKHTVNLNALLGNPYTTVCPSKFFHGTLLYNVHHSLKAQADVVTYIQEKLEYSPGLFKVFKLLHQKIFTALNIKIPKKKSRVSKLSVTETSTKKSSIPKLSSCTRKQSKYFVDIDYDGIYDDEEIYDDNDE
ncbi:protein asteroid-like [Aphidius gifuensis]|uniref:protein asteroid-like n=1 Tax=Aphidius gifuensis TaxID=684658 RepID=UPI001CDD6DF9|nr:protein asteroid-like [Aphidius gifuensis]